jgi:hypothetical protein
MTDLLFCSNSQLVTEMEDCSAIPDREEAHCRADEILVIALLRAVDEELTYGQATAIIAAYRDVEKWYA